MQRVSFLVTGLVLFLAATIAGAAPVMSVGHVYAPLNGTVSFDLLVSNAANAATEDIEGMLLTLQIGDGSGTAPKVQSIDMLSGTIWTGHASSAAPVIGGDEPQFASWLIITDAFGDYVNANGVLAKVVIDTAGAALGDYSLKLIGVKGSGSDTDFQNAVGQSVGATLTNGTLTVVPEPASATPLCALALTLLRRRGRR